MQSRSEKNDTHRSYNCSTNGLSTNISSIALYKTLHQEDEQHNKGDTMPNCCLDKKTLLKVVNRVKVPLCQNVA